MPRGNQEPQCHEIPEGLRNSNPTRNEQWARESAFHHCWTTLRRSKTMWKASTRGWIAEDHDDKGWGCIQRHQESTQAWCWLTQIANSKTWIQDGWIKSAKTWEEGHNHTE